LLFSQYLTFLATAVYAATKTWPFTTSSNYTFDSDKIEISSGQAQFKTPADWYNANWKYRQKITISSDVTDSDLENFTLLVSLTDNTNDIFSNAQSDGDDMLFTSSDGTTKLNHEIEDFNTTSGSEELVVFVNVPSISSSTNTEIYMYYGNSSASSQQNASETFDDNYVSVSHLKEAISHEKNNYWGYRTLGSENGADGGDYHFWDSDNQRDICIAAEETATAVCYLIQDTETATEVTIGSSLTDIEDVAIGNLTIDDNRNDLAYFLQGGQELGFYHCTDNTNGATCTKVTLYSAPYSVHNGFITDVDNDGYDDIIYISSLSSGNGEVGWFENPYPTDPTVGGNWTKHIINASGLRGFSMGVGGDYNRGDFFTLDGAERLIISNRFSESISIYTVDGSNDNWSKTDISSSGNEIRHISVKDLDGDGDLDIAGPAKDTGTSDGKLIIWENTGSLSFTQHVVAAGLTEPMGVGIHNVDSDDDLEIIVTEYDQSTYVNVLKYDMNSISNWTETTIYNQIYAGDDVFFEDLDSDGLSEVISTWDGSGSGQVFVLNQALENVTSSTSTTGKINGAQSYSNAYSNLGSSSSLKPTDALTISAWINPSSVHNGSIISGGEDTPAREGYTLRVRDNGRLQFNALGDSAIFNTEKASAYDSTEGWIHIAGVYNGSTVQLFINGSGETPESGPTAIDYSTQDPNVYIGVRHDGSGGKSYYFNGKVDEVRISNIARTESWIEAEYRNQNTPSTYLSFASSENPYPSDNPTIQPTSSNSQAFVSLSSFSESATKNSGEIKYQISNDSGTTWYWYNSDWATTSSGYSEANTASVINTNVSSFPVGDGEFLFRAYLHSDATQLVQLDSITLTGVFDVTSPFSFDLDSPGNNFYTNSERPTFKWKTTTDADTGLSKYKLEIDNGSSGDFTIDNIPTSRTTDYKTTKYLIHYENFSDSDSSNNYISLHTKSSSNWGPDDNDGKLKEGKRTWKIKAVDNSGNEREESRTLFVDRSEPNVEATQINSASFADNLATTDKTPIIYGKITDSLIGDKTDNYVASGPKEVEIKIEKKNYLGLYDLHTLSTVNLTENYWSSDASKITDNSKNTSNKYSAFSYTPSTNLPLGSYKITLTGKDKADNTSSETSFTLSITTLAQITTPEEKEIIEEEIKELPKEEQEKVKEELEITKPKEISPKEKAFPLLTKIGNFVRNRMFGTASFFSSLISYTRQTTSAGIETIKQGFQKPKQFASKFGEWLFYSRVSFKEIVLDKEPTRISEVRVEEVGKDYAVVTWKTNHHATSKLNYGLTFDYGQDIQFDKKVKEHKIKITGLNPETKYCYEVMSQNKNYVFDARHEFTTPKE